mmetsp:Transcript_94228/g.261746  ORF Transcript_94228/g.261746 Transcript_94228/m.261746 type:complete len:236 (+) Transcript_94228:262-969(+)
MSLALWGGRGTCTTSGAPQWRLWSRATAHGCVCVCVSRPFASMTAPAARRRHPRNSALAAAPLAARRPRGDASLRGPCAPRGRHLLQRVAPLQVGRRRRRLHAAVPPLRFEWLPARGEVARQLRHLDREQLGLGLQPLVLSRQRRPLLGCLGEISPGRGELCLRFGHLGDPSPGRGKLRLHLSERTSGRGELRSSLGSLGEVSPGHGELRFLFSRLGEISSGRGELHRQGRPVPR